MFDLKRVHLIYLGYRKSLYGNSRASKSLGRMIGWKIFEGVLSRGILPYKHD
jgi:hypothetical protein